MTHVIASSGTAWGGPTVVVRDLAAALSNRGVESTVVALTDPHSPARAFPESVRYRPCGPSAVPRLGIPSSPAIVSTLLREVRGADIVHLHELWHVPEAVGGVLAHLVGRAYVVSPHGGLDPHSLAFYRGLKGLSWAMYQRGILAHAAGIHVLTPQEESDVRSAGIETPVRTIPNGVDVEQIRSQATSAKDASPAPAVPYVLYVGRIDPRKGLDVLVDGFAEVASRRPEVKLVLVGPDNVGLWATLQARVRKLGLLNKVSYMGYVDGPPKFQLLAQAELFVLPSISEGMSIALLEALACGVPSVVSTQCNLPEIQTSGAGRVVEPRPSAFSEAILEILDDESLRQAMGREAERLARERFSLDRMAKEMIDFYGELVSGAA